MESAIVCEGLTKRYGDVLALDDLSLRVPAGSIFGFLGPNGAGKTTLLRLLTGLARPTAGRARVAGLDVLAEGMALRRRISVLEQQPQFYGWMKGRELLELVGELFGLRGAALRERVDEALAVTGLTEAANRRVGGYSGGMRQRLGLAQALVNRPEVLFLDEPASALDPAGRHEILSMVASMRGRATVFMSTHILADVERVCDAVAIIDRGKLIVSSSVAELEDRYAQPIFVLEPERDMAEQTRGLVVALRQAPWAGEVVEAEGVVRVVARDTHAASQAILPLVVAHGVALQRFERGHASLEDIFLRLTGSQVRQPAEVQ
jgi:ABC-2 type transport system ATP-binding protein